MYLTAEFQEKESVFQALRELKVSGFRPDDLEVFTDEPLEFPRDIFYRPSHMSLAVVTGAITFCLIAIGFVYFTQYNYKLTTGGMPLFSFWAAGVVFYELTMLGAIVITFLWFLWESGLTRRAYRVPLPKIEPGIICLRLRCSSSQADDAGRLLAHARAINVRKFGDLI